MKSNIVRSVSGDRAHALLKEKDGEYRLVCFGARWCSYCQQAVINLGVAMMTLGPRGIRCYKIDIDKDEDLGDKYLDKYGDGGIPLVLLIHNGRVVHHEEGLLEAEEYVHLAEDHGA
jgi:hypothetical protein